MIKVKGYNNMNQDDFRRLLATPQPRGQTTPRPSFFRPISKNYRQTFIGWNQDL